MDREAVRREKQEIRESFPLDTIVTPDEIVHCAHDRLRPRGIHRDVLDPEKRSEIPVLQTY